MVKLISLVYVLAVASKFLKKLSIFSFKLAIQYLNLTKK